MCLPGLLEPMDGWHIASQNCYFWIMMCLVCILNGSVHPQFIPHQDHLGPRAYLALELSFRNGSFFVVKALNSKNKSEVRLSFIHNCS